MPQQFYSIRRGTARGERTREGHDCRLETAAHDTVAVGEVVEVLNNTLNSWGSRDLHKYIRNAFFIVLLLFV